MKLLISFIVTLAFNSSIIAQSNPTNTSCGFVFGPKAAINCASVADKIMGYNGDWPEGTNSTIFFDLISNNKNLKEIDFCGIFIDSIPSSIGQVSNLEILHLTRGNITSIPKEIGELKKLKSLILGSSKTECGGNKVKFIPTEIGECKSLEYLGLAFSEILDIPDEIANCTNLKSIDLYQNTEITLEKLKELKKRFPNIEFITHLE